MTGTSSEKYCPWCGERAGTTLFIEDSSPLYLSRGIPFPDSVEENDSLLQVKNQRARERCNNCKEIVKHYSDITVVEKVEEE